MRKAEALKGSITQTIQIRNFTSSVVREVNMKMLLWIRARISNLDLEESCFSASTIYA